MFNCGLHVTLTGVVFVAFIFVELNALYTFSDLSQYSRIAELFLVSDVDAAPLVLCTAKLKNVCAQLHAMI